MHSILFAKRPILFCQIRKSVKKGPLKMSGPSTSYKCISTYSTVTDFAKFLGWSTLHPLITAM